MSAVILKCFLNAIVFFSLVVLAYLQREIEQNPQISFPYSVSHFAL